MSFFSPGFSHKQHDQVGVLMINLGTPQAPTPRALRRYLREFLADPRVVEKPRWQWLPILYFLVLTFRPRKSAALYRKIWLAEGSPLLVIGQKQATGVEQRLRATFGERVHVRVAMRYGKPSIPQVLREMGELGCRRILLLPLFPQYASATTGSSLQTAFRELARWRWVPEVKVVNHYHDHPGYIRALAQSVRDVWRQAGPAKMLLFSFHGVPKSAITAGDPYFCHCLKTSRLLAQALELPANRYRVAFQSKFGRDPWVQPATIDVVIQLGRQAVESLDVVCPGFSADCLETLEEIAITNREAFYRAGGGRFRYVPALNDRPEHLDVLAHIAETQLGGWIPAEDDRQEQYLRHLGASDHPWGEGF